MIFCEWGSPASRPYHGLSPQTWAAETARLSANAERALANEASMPTAALIPVPEGHDSGSEDDDDELAALRSDIEKAKGGALLLETTASGFGEGAANSPARDWDPRYLHPAPTEALVRLGDAAFSRVLAACGTPPSLFTDADGTAQREAVRRWHMGTVKPLARILEAELSGEASKPPSG